jgi:two-component system, chemotaxis family, chemotaxis protein CheY
MSPNRGKSILVVEDSRACLQIVRLLLAGLGFEDIDEAPDVLEALVKMGEKPYDLVLVDWQMEPVSGHELVKFVRGDDRFARTCVIVMTAAKKVDHVVAAKKAGADGFIGKPFSGETLKAKIDATFLARSA